MSTLDILEKKKKKEVNFLSQKHFNLKQKKWTLGKKKFEVYLLLNKQSLASLL